MLVVLNAYTKSHDIDEFIFAIVECTANTTHQVHYLWRLFLKSPDFGVTNVK